MAIANGRNENWLMGAVQPSLNETIGTRIQKLEWSIISQHQVRYYFNIMYTDVAVGSLVLRSV